MKTKIVTGYWMGITELTNNKWVGVAWSRSNRYLSGIINLSKNFANCEIVCYTHKINLDQLNLLKLKYNLINLTIKIKELDEIKYTNDINYVVDKVPNYMKEWNLDGRPPQVMWGKFDVIRLETTDDIDFIYWIDAGLQSVQLFPLRYNPHLNESDIWTSLEKQGNFSLLFNETILETINDLSINKFTTLLSTQPQDGYFSFDDYQPKRENYPIAGFFGGDKNVVLDYCNIFDNLVKKYTQNNILCFEQPIMKNVTDIIDIQKLLIFSFDIHQTPLTEKEFHYDLWDESKNLPKPIWRIWEELKYEKHKFTKDLQS
jgi:hypothetical protein